MLVGTSDQSRAFHPFAVAICSNESEDDFAFIFEALRTYNLTWKPEILLADASAAITAGFRKVFGDPKIRITCFFHVLKNLDKSLKPLPKRQYVQLKSDIRSMQQRRNIPKSIFTVYGEMESRR